MVCACVMKIGYAMRNRDSFQFGISWDGRFVPRHVPGKFDV